MESYCRVLTMPQWETHDQCDNEGNHCLMLMVFPIVFLCLKIIKLLWKPLWHHDWGRKPQTNGNWWMIIVQFAWHTWCKFAANWWKKSRMCNCKKATYQQNEQTRINWTVLSITQNETLITKNGNNNVVFLWKSCAKSWNSGFVVWQAF